MKITKEYQAARRKRFFDAGKCECGEKLDGWQMRCADCRRIRRLKYQARKANRNVAIAVDWEDQAKQFQAV